MLCHIGSTHLLRQMVRSGCVKNDCEALSELMGKTGHRPLGKFALVVPWGQ